MSFSRSDQRNSSTSRFDDSRNNDRRSRFSADNSRNHKDNRNNASSRDRNHNSDRSDRYNGGDRRNDNLKKFDKNDRFNRSDRNGRFNKGDRDNRGNQPSKFNKGKKFVNDNKFQKSKDTKSKTVLVQPHTSFPGVFTMRTRGTDALLTKSLTPGHAVYGEKLIATASDEYRLWSAHRSKIAAGILCGLSTVHILPGQSVLYLGAASGTTVSHVSDIVGSTGRVYAVEFSARSARDLVALARRRANIVPIVADARHPWKYRFLVPPVDSLFSDVAQPDQARIVALNASYFLKDGGGVALSIKANCIDCTRVPAEVYAGEVDRLRRDGVKPKEQVDLDPYEKDHAMVVAVYKPKSFQQ